MKELPNPTFPLSQLGLRAALWPAPAAGTPAVAAAAATVVALATRTAVPEAPLAVIVPPVVEAKPGITVSWARHLDDVRAAQRLRHDVFVGEMGARLTTPLAGHDIDLFDDFCEHLLVRDELTGQVIGTYRVLTPAQARRVGSTYSDTEFDLTRLRDLRERMVELGRSCVHAEHRQGGVILALWGALAGFMHRNKLDTMIGCASIPMSHNGVTSGDAAASIWRQLSASHLAPIQYQVQPRLPLPVERLDSALDVEPPALIKGYLRLGAKVLGAPAWDPDFNTADLPMLMRIDDLPARYRKHFLGA
ncbi:ornithine-acyl-ACP acyltransferase [Variovorax boronicumulans]|uniref:L-ornithine N(alpha)-acyltransferase n=1 Tax=Variovorax boronicumulans TaxID=436515 RepID=A0A250DL99_9BURK|nr:GNAT family N-acyltransferase [Variovorax boronicumulans]ATA55145.1 ornithine-acyl-ACP acyltransferase [Variovorax boronicumulans]